MAAAQPPHEALDVEALGASVATHVTDACQVLVEQVAATGVEAALAKGRSADHKSALAKAEKAQGNTQRYGAQVDMCHFGLVGSGNPNPSNFRATHMAAATLRPALTPWLQTSMGIAPPMLHHGSHGVASKLFAPKGRTVPWASTPICGMGRPWRSLCVWGLSRGVSFGWRVVAC